MEAVYNGPGTHAPSIEVAARQFVFLALAAVVLRYLYPVSGPWASIVLYLLGWSVLLRGRTALHEAMWSLGVTVGIPAFVYFVARLAMRFALIPADGAIEERVLLLGYSLAPAVTIGTILWQWELWCRRSARARVLFAPLIAIFAVALFWSQAELRRGVLGHPTVSAIYAIALLVAIAVHSIVRTPLSAGRRHVVVGVPSTPGNGYGGSAARRSNPARAKIGRRAALAALLLLFLTAGLLTLLYRAWQREAVSASGGLMRPTAFRFDFADYLTLETEIGLSRDLVLLYREDRMPPGRLIRRYVLSAYSPRRGFYRLDRQDEPSPVPPLALQSFARSTYGDRSLSGARESVDQEYYIVNFDPDAFMAVPEPRLVEQLEIWDRASFNSAYRVESLASVSFVEVILEESGWPENLDETWREVYIGEDIPDGVAELAHEITAGIDGYYATVIALRDYLHQRYYYSLAPGVASDGDQLGHFLFESRKGYCSYFAFSMALMARSLGIPARVAVGFFIDPDTGMLGFYPIRGDMAHAWVEIWFAEQGWIAFDPTSQTVAPGEIVSTDYGIDQEQLSALIEEILSHGELGVREEEPSVPSVREQITEIARRAARRWYLAPPLFLLFWLGIRFGRWRRLVRRRPYRAALLLFSRTRELLAPSERDLPYLQTGGALADAGVLAAALRFDRREQPDAPTAMRALCSAAVRATVAERGGIRGWALRLSAVLPPKVRRRTRSERGAVLPTRATSSVVRKAEGGSTRTAVILLPLFVFLLAGVPAELSADPTLLEDQIIDSLDAENYEEAIRRIAKAQEQYPDDPRFSLVAGDLYFDQGLYHLAEEAYREALALGADVQSTSHALADTLARSNDDEEAIRVLEAMLARDPGRRDVIADVAWLYFKTHRLERARALLEETIETSGAGADLSMTLATVYSGLWDYESARRAYADAIAIAEEQDNRLFLAVAYYNLSILHAKFYRWDDALAAAERSLEYSERSSGYLIRGEYQEQRLLWEYAARDYEQAHATDSVTPLPELSLAILWIEAGYPERAIAQLEQILEDENRNWIYNYGTDPVRFDAQVHGALADAYEAAAKRDRLFRPGGIGARIARRLRSIHRRAISWYHRGIYSRLTFRIADAYAREEQELMSDWNRMIAAESWRSAAARHAAAARAIETGFNPAADADYRLLLAEFERDRGELAALRGELLDPWQRPLLLEALLLSIELEPRSAESLAPRLYAISPGSFLIHGIRIPLALEIEGAGISNRDITRTLSRLGFAVKENAPLGLEIGFVAGGLEFSVRDRESGTELRSGTVAYNESDYDAVLVELARTLTTVAGLDSGA